MSVLSPPRAKIDDLYGVEGKAELIGGRIVRFMASGVLPSRVAARIFRSLDDYAEQRRVGLAFPDGIGFAVPEMLSGRESFSPDAAYYVGPLPANLMRFIEGPPTFAIEVRSENDYGPAKDVEYAEERADYFAAGTLVVWDVDPVAETVTVYRTSAPMIPVVFKRGDVADAEAAAPGWRLPVAQLFPPPATP